MEVTLQVLKIYGCLLYLLFVAFQPVPADASKLIYTIQVGSFEDIRRAARQYYSVIDRLNKEELNNLRIEKIAKYYSTRIGNFEDPNKASILHRKLKHLFSSAMLMKAYMRNERIIKLYPHTSSVNITNQNDSLSVSKSSKIPQSLMSNKNKKIEDQLFYTIQIGSFTALDRAQNEFASVVQKLFDRKPDHMRIEKVGEYNTVRVGKFEKYVRAEKYLSSVKSHFESAFIIQAYIRDERIVRDLWKERKQIKNSINFRVSPVNSVSSIDSSHSSGSTDDVRSNQYNLLPESDKFILQGTVISNNVRLAIIEDANSKQSGLYNLNDKVGGFIVSDILDKAVILNDKNTSVKILLRGGNQIALSHPEPDLSQDIDEERSRSILKRTREMERILKRRELNR